MQRLRQAFLGLLVTSLAWGQDAKPLAEQSVPLTVPSGVPLRLYVTKRFSKKSNAPVQAKLLTAVYAFDRPVIPAGTIVQGHVANVQPVSKWERARAILGGDFTPLRTAPVMFTSLRLANGTDMPIATAPSVGLNSLVPLVPGKSRPIAHAGNGGLLDTGKQRLKDQVSASVANVKSIPAMVRAENKKEWLTDFLMSKLPYHPQYVRSRTRFNAELRQPLDFGAASVTPSLVALLGTQPSTDSTVHARLLNDLTSRSSVPGEKLEAVLEEPLFSGVNDLVLPAGTRLTGVVVLAKRAGWFHHGGRLRFRFQEIALAPEIAQLMSAPSTNESLPTGEHGLTLRTQGMLTAAESSKSPIKVDNEGGVQAKDSKTRFIGTLVSLLIARSAADNDPIRSSNGAVTGTSSNVGGRTLGGGLGFGLLGSVAAQSSRTVGTALGYYGLAWSLYSTVIARGSEVQFERNSAVDIGFNARPVPAKVKTEQKSAAGVH